MTRSPKPVVRPSRGLSLQTLGTALAIVLAAAGVATVACTSQVNTGAPSSTVGPFCPSADGSDGYECNVGDPPCFPNGTESNCNGEYYCWADRMWHCEPPDSGGPAPVVAGDDDEAGASDAADDAQPAGDAGPAADATGPADASHGG
jgi:hypothetical protein